MAPEIPEVVNEHTRFLLDLSMNACLEGFAWFDKTREGGIHALGESRRSPEEGLSAALDEYDHGGCDSRVVGLLTRRAEKCA